MSKHVSIQSIYRYCIVALILLAVAISAGVLKEWNKAEAPPTYTLSDIKKAYPQAATIDTNSDKSLTITDANGHLLGYVLISEDLKARYQGYNGNLPLLIAFDKTLHISGTYLLNNIETPRFITYVEKEGLLNSWNQLRLDSTLIATQTDAITGATLSSNAIIKTLHKTVGNYLSLKQQSNFPSAIRIAQLVLMATLLFFSLSMVLAKQHKKFYFYYLIAVFGIMGLWLKKILSLELVYNWLGHGVAWQSNWELIVILSMSLFMSIMGHKKYYCNYLCPMGAIQILVSKASPFKKRSLNLKISTITLRSIYLTFIWASLILGFALPLSEMEPFVAFSFAVASPLMLTAGLIIILLSLFFNRPWCELCPTGCLLDSISALKNKHK